MLVLRLMSKNMSYWVIDYGIKNVKIVLLLNIITISNINLVFSIYI